MTTSPASVAKNSKFQSWDQMQMYISTSMLFEGRGLTHEEKVRTGGKPSIAEKKEEVLKSEGERDSTNESKGQNPNKERVEKDTAEWRPEGPLPPKEIHDGRLFRKVG
jgi:hypothetical protein